MGYKVDDLKSILSDAENSKDVLVEVGGTRVPLKHVYVVDEHLVDEGSFGKDQIGTLVIDLDI